MMFVLPPASLRSSTPLINAGGEGAKGIIIHFPNYNEFLEKSKPYVFAKSGENWLREEIFFEKLKNITKIPLSFCQKRGIV